MRGARATCPPCRHTITIVRAPSAQHTPFRRTALLPHEPVPLVTKALNLRLHPGQLKVQDFPTLPSDLDAHVLDLGTDFIERPLGPASELGVKTKPPEKDLDFTGAFL